VLDKEKPAWTHRGGGATTGWRGQLGTAVFRWRAAPTIVDECGEVLVLEGDKGLRKWWLIEESGGSRRRSPMNGEWRRGSVEISCGPTSSGRRRWTGGGEGVVRARAVRKEERKWGKGGGVVAAVTILNPCRGGGERGGGRSTGERRPAGSGPRPAGAGGVARPAIQWRGDTGSLAHGAQPAAGEGGRREVRRPTREKKWSGSNPDEQWHFLFIEKNFKLVRFILTKWWTYQALKILNKIWLESA
jgi:hypothetical protein